jgi:protein-tyrosine phosphatase
MTDLPPEIQVAIDTPFHNVLPPEPGSLGPNSVGGLYIGSLSAVVGGSVNALRSLNISIIIQVLHIPFLVLSEEEGFTCYRVDIDDQPSQNLDAQLLEQVCVYIEEMRNSGKGVLVHCQQASLRIP